MTQGSLEDALGSAIQEWFDGTAINVHSALDAMVAVIASIAVKAGCNTEERSTILADHMKSNLTIQLNRERAVATASRNQARKLDAELFERAARQALETGESVRVEGGNESVLNRKVT